MKSKLKYPFLLSILATMSLRTLFGNEHPPNADPVGAVRSAKQILSVESGGDTTKGMSLAGKDLIQNSLKLQILLPSFS